MAKPFLKMPGMKNLPIHLEGKEAEISVNYGKDHPWWCVCIYIIYTLKKYIFIHIEEEMPLALKIEHLLGSTAKFHLAFEPFTLVNTHLINQAGGDGSIPESWASSVTPKYTKALALLPFHTFPPGFPPLTAVSID